MAGKVNIPNFKDVRNSLRKHSSKRYGRVPLTQKTVLAIHHSATKSGSAESFANYHVVTLGWAGIGYHYVIERDGTVKWCHDLETVSYNVGGHNSYTVGICLVGNFATEQEPTKEQKESLRALVHALKKKYPNFKNVKGHNEFSGHYSSLCPSFDFRAVINDNSPSKALPEKQRKQIATYEVKPGDTLWNIATTHNVTVDKLMRWNNITDPRKLQVGQRILIRPVKLHTIEKGDTFYHLSKEYGVSVEAIKAANPALNPHSLKIGQTVAIPLEDTNEQPKQELKKEKWTLPSVTLRRGSRGKDVKQVQRALNALHFYVNRNRDPNGGIDGIYGALTEDAVRRFQMVYLPYEVDGVYGKNTRKEMLKQLND